MDQVFGVVKPVSAEERRKADAEARLARMNRAAERRHRATMQGIGFALKVALAAKNSR